MVKGNASTAKQYDPNYSETGAELWARTSLTGEPLPLLATANGDGTATLTVGATFSPSGTQDVNVKQIGGTAVTAGAGIVTAGTQRITLASDDPGVVSLQLIDDSVQTTGSTVATKSILAGIRNSAGNQAAIQGQTTTLDGIATSSAGTHIQSASYGYVFNGSTWDRMPGNTTGINVNTHPVTQSGTWNIGTVTTLTGITNVVHIDDNSGSITVDGTLTSNVGTIPTSTTGTESAPSVGTSSTTILASNASRKGLMIVNNSTQTVYVRFASTATVANSIPLYRGANITWSGLNLYTGIITGIVSSGSADVRVEEFT